MWLPSDARPDRNSETVFRGAVGRFNCTRASRRKSGSVFFPLAKSIIGAV